LESFFILIFSAVFTNIFLLLHLLWESSGEAEVTNLYAALVCEKHVAWLEITMNHICSMQEVDCAQKVVQNDFSVLHVK
jgi:hypothetical protein